MSRGTPFTLFSFRVNGSTPLFSNGILPQQKRVLEQAHVHYTVTNLYGCVLRHNQPQATVIKRRTALSLNGIMTPSIETKRKSHMSNFIPA